MIVVGELINGSRQPIAQAIARRDGKAILEVARQQAAGGAHLLDVNAGTTPEKEVEDLAWLVGILTAELDIPLCKDLAWLVGILTAELDIPLCIDSPNVAAMEAGLKRAGQRGAMINSITAEKSRLESFLPLIGSHDPQVIALCMDDEGVPKQATDRLRVATRLAEILTGSGLSPEKIFLDPIISPISVDGQAGRTALETLALIKENIPEARTICGLSNISFGLPLRRLLNRNLLSLMLAAGLDAAILDPTDKSLMADLVATQTLLGRDEHCLGYITAAREGTIN
jgi:5-methyltetrahydrofolate--homocysteine methyltransferase